MARPPAEYFLSQMLTREEWLTVYGFYLSAMIVHAYGAEGMDGEEFENTFGTLHTGMRWSIRELLERGYRFHAIELDGRGKLHFKSHEPVCPANVLFIDKILTGKLVSPILAIETAFEEFEKYGVVIDREPMRELLEQAKADVEESRREIERDPELVSEIKAFLQESAQKAVHILQKKEFLN